MVAPTPDNMEWIRHSHLFQKIEPHILAGFLESMESHKFAPGEVLTPARADCQGLCLVRSGKVALLRVIDEFEEGEEPQTARMGILESRDYYGEECVLSEDSYPTHVYIARGQTEGEIYCWPMDAARAALAEHRSMTEALQLVRDSRRWLYRHRPKWLPEDEIVHLYVGRPLVALLPRIWGAMLILMVASLLMMWGGLQEFTTFVTLGAALAAAGGLLFVWEYIDWRNDYCVVTNRRVAWIDKVLFLYESRNEAALETILSFNVRTDYWGRLLNYGDVEARTYGGKVVINEVSSPQVVVSLIEEYWQRRRSRVQQQTQEQIRQLVRMRIGLTPSSEDVAKTEMTAPQRQSALERFLDKIVTFFQQRSESGGIVTYRKHWFLLLTSSCGWILWWLLWPVGWGFIVSHLQTGLTPLLALGVGVLLWLPAWAGLGWQVVDWRNDVYQLTPEYIVDVYRKPFGTEDKQASPLESIENMTYQRLGFWGWLLNFGEVQIHVGTTTMVWEGVARPDMVQQEIFRRVEQRRRAKQEAEERKEGERVLNLLKIYHEVSKENEGGERPEG